MKNTEIIGLSSKQVIIRQKEHGYNIQASQKSSLWSIVLRQFGSPIIYILIFAVLISLFTGDYLNGAILSILIIINSVIGFTQEYHSARLATELNNLVKKVVLCLRDGKYQSIDTINLVKDDIIKLKLGDLVPADAIVVESNNLQINQSVLTGEVENIPKINSEQLLSGTAVSLGTATAQVTNIGAKTTFGRIASLTLNTHKKSEFTRTMAKLSSGFMVTGFVYLVGIFGLQLALGKVENWQTSLIFVLALTISIIPEALPIVTSLSLSTQAIKLGKLGLLVKHNTVLEDLGNMDILCTDKTGTLTQNKFEVITDSYSPKLLQVAQLLSIDSLESFEVAIQKYTKELSHIQSGQETVIEIPFNPKLRISAKKIGQVTYYHGSPVEILGLIKGQETQTKIQIQEAINQKENSGIKCLSYAVELGGQWEYLGAIYFADKLKPDTKTLIQKAKTLGLEIKILTGDSLAIATHIGLESGLIDKAASAISAELIDFDQSIDSLYLVVDSYAIIARCTPENKYRIIQALQSKKVVGYLGDGINDAPALKIAQIGLVVNTSSPIAKETADIIMTDANLHNLILSVEKGRSIFENINKYLKSTLSSSFGNFFTMGLLSLILPFNPMLGVQVIISNLITDLPLVSLASDRVSRKDIRKPKHQNLHRLILICVLLGLVSSIFDFIFVALNRGLPVGQIQTSWFLFSIMTELAILFSIRTRGFFLLAAAPKKTTILYSILALISSIIISVYLFQFIQIETISPLQVARLAGLTVGYFAVSEAVKFVYYRIYFNQATE